MNRCLCYLIPFLTIGIAYTQDIDWKKLPADPVNSIRIAPYRELAPLENGEKEISFPNLYLQFNTSGLYSLLTDWKNQNILSDGTYPSTQSIIFGGEAGCVINKYLQIGIGYEYFFTTKVTTLYATGDQITSTFFYGSLKAGIPLESVPDLYLYAGLDIGSITATEVLENYYGSNYNKTGSTSGYRVMIGGQYYLLENWSIMAGGGYLFGKINKVTVDGQVWPNYTLDFSGFILRFAVNYHISL